MMKIAIGTKNPAKVNAIKMGFHGIEADFCEINASSDVSEQPLSDQETIQGAINRSKNSLASTEADIGIGLEGGVVETEYGMFLCNWGAITDKQEKTFIAGGARILLPDEIASEIKKGYVLGEVMAKFTSQKDIGKNEGAVGIFTNGYVNRTEMFLHVVKLLVGQLTYHRLENKN